MNARHEPYRGGGGGVRAFYSLYDICMYHTYVHIIHGMKKKKENNKKNAKEESRRRNLSFGAVEVYMKQPSHGRISYDTRTYDMYDM